MRLLVLGDYISDVYTYGKAVRLCPEAPVPVLIPEKEIHSDGGAGLVFNQLKELGADVQAVYGSESVKYRYFAGSHLICRVDNDSYSKNALEWSQFPNADAYVIADYGKGGMTQWLGVSLAKCGKPIFIDAKHHWHWYAGQDSIVFPNEHEFPLLADHGLIVRKLGAQGAQLNNEKPIAATTTDVVDVTGAGDIFMASYVYAATNTKLTAMSCLRFANAMAGESCRHVGTYVVPQAFGKAYLDRLLASEGSEPPSRGYFLGSSQSEHLLRQQLGPNPGALSVTASGNLPVDYVEVVGVTGDGRYSPPLARIPLESPSDPIGSPDAHIQGDPGSSHLSDRKLQSDCKSQIPSESERQYGHTQELDQSAPVLRPKPQA